MKKAQAIIFILFVLMVSCTDSGLDLLQVDESNLNVETQIDSYFEENDDLVSSVVELPDLNFSGRSSGLDGRFCSNVKVLVLKKVSSDPDSIIVDFSPQGCTDNKANTRTGKIIITFTGDRRLSHSVTFVDFFVNGNKVSGTKSVGKTSTSPFTNNVVLTGGKIIWADGTFATREANLTRVWNRGLPNPLDDNMVVKKGSTSAGVNRSGQEYLTEVTSDITFKFKCGEGVRPVMIPVSGTRIINVGGKTITIDYGTGDCDTKITVTVNGKTKEINLKEDLD